MLCGVPWQFAPELFAFDNNECWVAFLRGPKRLRDLSRRGGCGLSRDRVPQARISAYPLVGIIAALVGFTGPFAALC
jgi:hypothetical protein